MAKADDIKAKIRPSDIISKYVQLKPGGSGKFKAPCPFHAEKTPSFTVDDNRGTWRCFGACQTGGDIFDFIMKADNVEFKEAVERVSPGATKREGHSIDDLNKMASTTFLDTLLSGKHPHVLELLEKRGLTLDDAKRFGLGFDNQTLKKLYQSKKVALKSAVYSGLLRIGKDYEKIKDADYPNAKELLKGRLTFEIRSEYGQVIAFAGRSLADGGTKYLNTKSTHLFDKSNTLYGLNWAMAEARSKQAIVVVEGYMDVIRAHIHGYTNVVACMSSSITPHQLKKLSTMLGSECDITLCLDNDDAGHKGMDLAMELSPTIPNTFRRVDLSVYKVKDVDELLTKHPDNWFEAVSNAEIQPKPRNVEIARPSDERKELYREDYMMGLMIKLGRMRVPYSFLKPPLKDELNKMLFGVLTTGKAIPDELQEHANYVSGLLFAPATMRELTQVIRIAKIQHAKELLKGMSDPVDIQKQAEILRDAYGR